MFHSSVKRAGQDKNKNTAKFLDAKRDTHGRLKALRLLIDLLTEFEVQDLFKEYSSEIFCVFYEEFTAAELNAKSRGAKLKDDIEELLELLERILILLPDKIHAKWHFNTISLILRKLIHHGNILSIRELGMRLFMLWLQILQENVDDVNLAMYASIIPGFPSPIEELMKNERLHGFREQFEYLISCINGQNYSHAYFQTKMESETEWCIAEGCSPICPPQQGEKIAPTDDKKFLDKILDFMSRRMLDIKWEITCMRESGFYHMFAHFKRFYLPHIFPLWEPDADRLYNQPLEMIKVPITEDVIGIEKLFPKRANVMIHCQRAVLFWLIVFTFRLKQKTNRLASSSVDSKSVDTLKSQSSLEDTLSPTTAKPPVNYDTLCEAADIVRTVLYSTRENVLVVNEIFRQGFMMPLNCADTMNHILLVYKEWFFKVEERPVFMQEPRKEREDLAASRELLPTSADDSPMLRTPSYREAVQNGGQIFFANIPMQNVRVGFQPTLRLFIAITSQVFFLKQRSELVAKHSDVCKQTMKIYRNIVLEMRVDTQTWDQLLHTLLKITAFVLDRKPSNPRTSTLGGQMAPYLLQTLFVTWIRASLQVHIKSELWDEMLCVANSLTSWEELIKEWATTTETLTRVMARTVYNIDLQDPPLEQLTHRSKVRQRIGPSKVSSTVNLEKKLQYPQKWQKTVPHKPDKQTIPRCASEPGLGDSLVLHHVGFSDSALLSVTTAVTAGKKKTLAEIVDQTDPEYLKSFDSVGSNSVFQQSINSTQGLQVAIGEVENEVEDIYNLEEEDEGEDEDEEESDSEAYQVRYAQLKTGDTDSDHSSLNIPMSLSLASIASHLSESSQNLLGSDFCLNIDEKQAVSKSTCSPVIEEPPAVGANIASPVETPREDALNLTLTPRTSVSSEHDLINFEMDAVTKKGVSSADEESIDSNNFTLIDHEHFADLNISASFMKTGQLFEGNEVNKESHVRFAEEETAGEEHISGGEESTSDEEESVINGGVIEGWTRVSAIVLWRRVIGILGNVNDIREPTIHAHVYKHLIKMWHMLETVRRNQGVSIDNKATPSPPSLTPPLFFASTWCFQAMASEERATHKPGRVLAFKLACKIFINNHGLTPSTDHLLLFARLLHRGLTSPDQEIINAIVGECSSIFSMSYEGVTCLILDFISACNSVISTQYMNYPRKQAMTILGSLICFSTAFSDLQLFHPSDITSTQPASSLQEKVLVPILKAARNDPSCRARCTSIGCIGLFIVDALVNNGGHTRINDCLAILITLLEFHSQVVSTVSLDVLSSLTFYYQQLNSYDSTLVHKIIEALCHTIMELLVSSRSLNSENEHSPQYVSKLILCLLDWVMTVPQEQLLKTQTQREDSFSYLHLVVKTLKECCEMFDTCFQLHHLEKRRSLNVNQIFLNENRPIRLARVHNDINNDDSISEDDETDLASPDLDEQRKRLVKLTAEYSLQEVVNFYENFPFYTGAVRGCSLVTETDDQALEESHLMDALNVQYLLLNNTTLLTLIELPQEISFSKKKNLTGLKTISRLILRDAAGKYCWDVSDIYNTGNCSPSNLNLDLSSKRSFGGLERKHSRNLSVSGGMRLTTSTCCDLPTWTTIDANTDRVDQLLRYVGQSSPECFVYPERALNSPAPVPAPLSESLQPSLVTAVLKQHNEEENYVHEISNDARVSARDVQPPVFHEPSSDYYLSKLLLHQLGFLSSEKRDEIELLDKGDRLIRDIINLDRQPSRETQKIAVFYVAPGQEDKHSILLNKEGSVKFENFLSGMGWEVKLDEHTGFMGGLEKNLSTGESAPYFATHSLEVIFHVSTRMPSRDEDSVKTKLRHLGNDEIHIIWSEHSRDFRRGIINTEFGDVLLIIYPLQNNLYRIQIDCKYKIPPFGPLFDGAVVNENLLPLLVRSTAIAAGRAKRTTIPLYNQYFEERARCIREISKNRVAGTSYEEFCSLIYSPGMQPDFQDETDNLSRTKSLPMRKSSMPESVVTKIFDDNFRDRINTYVAKKPSDSKTHSLSNTSLNADEPNLFSDTDSKDLKDRRKSISRPKRLRKKTLEPY